MSLVDASLIHVLADDTVSLPGVPQQLADALGTNLFVGQLLMAIIMMLIPLLPTLILTRGKNTPLELVIGMIGIILGTALGWVPFWIPLCFIILIALMFSGKVRDWMSGHGGN